MMSGHSANPIFFNKKRTLAKLPTPLLPIKSHFCLTSNPPPPPPSKWASYVYHPLRRFLFWTGYFFYNNRLLHMRPQHCTNFPDIAQEKSGPLLNKKAMFQPG